MLFLFMKELSMLLNPLELRPIMHKVGRKVSDMLIRSGCDVLCTSYADFSQAITLAQKAEVTVLVVGLNSSVAAEGLDRHNLSLPGSQVLHKLRKLNKKLDLVESIRANAQRLVLILVNDSPVGVNDSLADAIMGN